MRNQPMKASSGRRLKISRETRDIYELRDKRLGNADPARLRRVEPIATSIVRMRVEREPDRQGATEPQKQPGARKLAEIVTPKCGTATGSEGLIRFRQALDYAAGERCATWAAISACFSRLALSSS